ncbi:MAG: translocation/assembly module TamB domain-containing protein [Planctomycetota bacterium]
MLRAARRLGAWLLFVVLVALVLLQAAYLLRRPLFERLVCTQVGQLLGSALGGEVHIERLGGSWITGLYARGIRIDTGGVLRSVRDGELQVQLDPLALAFGDLGGLRRLRVRASALHLDLDAPAGDAAPAPDEPGAPLDLDALLALLAEGAEIEIGELAVAGRDAQVQGPARVVLAPAGSGRAARDLRVDGPGLALAADVRRGGAVRVEAEVDDLMRVPRLFAAVAPLDGGDATITATLHLAPFAAEAAVRVRDLRVRGRTVDRLAATGRVDEAGLSALAFELDAPGARLVAAGVSMAFADVLASVRGDLELDLRDLRPYRELLPQEVQDQLPITGRLRARAGDGRLRIGDGGVECASARLSLSAGAVQFDGRPGLLAGAPVRAAVQLRDPSRLPLPADLPLRPTGGELRVAVGSGDLGFEVEATLDLAVADADGRAGRLNGGVTAVLGDRITVRPDLALTGDALRGTAQRLGVRGAASLAGGALLVERLTVGVDERDDAVVVDGGLRLDAAPAEMLQQADLRVAFAALPLAPLRTFVAAAPSDGALDGELAVADGTARVDLQVRASGAPTLAADAEARLRVQAELAPDGLQVTGIDLATPAGTVAVRGTIAGLGARALLDGTFDLAACQPQLTADVDLPALGTLDLAALAGVSVAGAVQGSATLSGGWDPLTMGAALALREVEVRDASGTLVQDLGGRVLLAGGALQLEAVQGRVLDRPVQLDGTVTRTDDGGLRLRGLRVADDSGGELEVDGVVGDLGAGDWRAAVRAADVRMQLRTLSLAPWLGLAGVDAGEAHASGTLAWNPAEAPPLRLQLEASTPRLPGAVREQAARVALALEGAADGIRVTELRAILGDLVVAGRGSLASSPQRLLDEPQSILDAPIAFEVTVPTTDLSQLPKEQLGLAMLDGRLGAVLRLGGTARQPEPTIDLDFAGGSLLTADGQRLDAIAAKLQVTADAVVLERVEASRGRGPVAITGAFRAPGPLWSHWAAGEVDLQVRGENVLLHRKAGLKVRADLDVAAKGPLADFAVTGEVRLLDSKLLARIPLLELNRTGGRSTATGITIPGVDLGPQVGAHLDVRVLTAEPFAIRNNVVDGAFDVELAVRGSLQQPLLEGTVSGPEARLILPGIRLRANTLLVEFPRGNSQFPQLTVNARGRRHGYDVQVIVRGRYDRPEVLLSSDPPLPAEDLVVLVTTGARPESLRGTAGVSTVLGAYLAQELADWIFGSESTEAKESFLDRFTIETGAEMSQGGTESVVVEFRVLDHVFLQGERDVYEDLNMGVVYRVRF